MRTRHRIPTIFNLSMVDVLCCALGCVILLWLVNFREAKRRTVAVGETAARLADTQMRLDSANADLAATRRRLDAAAEDLAATRRQLAAAEQRARDLRGQYDAAQAKNVLASKSLAQLRTRLTDTEDRLAKQTQSGQMLSRDLAAAEKDRAALQDLLRKQETQVRATAKNADDLAGRLRDAEARAKKLREQLQTDQKALRDQTASADTRLLTLQKELTQARSRLDQLQEEKKLLAHQVARARVDAENRFAGIALTGRRVVFLVDMSGSMDYLDAQTPDANKWAAVRETLQKIIRSLPDLEKFQVVLFAREASFPLGTDGRWLTYDPKTSAQQIHKALTATKPKGATNMYAAFDAAFRFRAEGLDTIYVLSDGLPNVGPGLTAEQAKLKETEKAEVLGNYVRKLLRTTWNRPVAGQPRVRINTVGFFYESPDVGAFLWALARENDGSFVGMSRP